MESQVQILVASVFFDTGAVAGGIMFAVMPTLVGIFGYRKFKNIFK